MVSATARAQLLSGDVDPRLPTLIAAMVDTYPVRIVDFGDQSPGGGPASLLRSMDLATHVSAAHLAAAAYLSWMQGVGKRPARQPPRVERAGHAACWQDRAADRV